MRYAFLLLMSSLLLVLSPSPSIAKIKTFNGTQISYDKPITDQQVEALGKYLIQSQFTDGTPKSVNLIKLNQLYIFKMVVREGFEVSQNFIEAAQVFATEMSIQLFEGKTIEVHLCDPFFKTFKKIQMNADYKHKIFQGTYVFYSKKIPTADAERLGQYLIKSQFTDGTRKDVYFDRDLNSATYLFKMVFKADLQLTPQWISTFQAFAQQLSKDVFQGSPVEIQLLNEAFEVIKMIPFSQNTTPMPAFDVSTLGTVKNFDETHLYYTSRVSAEKAESVGQFLIQQKFTDGTRKDVQIDRDGLTYHFRMVFNSKLKFNDEWRSNFKMFAASLSQNIFDNQVVEVHLTDIFFTTLHTVVFDPEVFRREHHQY